MGVKKNKPYEQKVCSKSKKALSEKIKAHEIFLKVPEMCIPYSVKANEAGDVFYLNEVLCKKLGLLDLKFTKKDLKELKKEILETFNLQIINDYDRLNHPNIKSKDVKPYFCFATRYLQLQHKNKKGRTSGDGRAIWNGTIEHKGKKWDISSRGTGVTSIAPGVVEAGIPLPTGSIEYGYSCGLSDNKEIYTSIVMSERFHQMGFSTERILAGIDIGGGLGICVRASENLIRPAHLFRYLKLNDHHGAKNLLDHVINRDFRNKKIDFNTDDKNCYDKYLSVFSENFSKLCAKSKYSEIFIWLDWDGDNILMDGGIIDYGSVRHFGSYHNKYKYKDTDRYSTNLEEQVKKAKQTVQIFSQLINFVKTENKNNFKDFKDNIEVKKFEERVFTKELSYFLKDLGLSEEKVKTTLAWHKKKVSLLYSKFLKLKNKKASKIITCADGKNAWPLLNANHILADLKKIKNNTDLLVYRTEFTSFLNNKKIDAKDIFEFIAEMISFENELGFIFKYAGDAKTRLTTAAILHIVDLIADSKNLSEKQKKIEACIDYGHAKNSTWITKIKDLYRDEL